MEDSLMRRAEELRWRGKRTWNYVRTVSDLDPPRIVYRNKDGRSLVVFLQGEKPEGFDLELPDGKVFLYDGKRHYNYGYWSETLHGMKFAKFVPGERKDFDKDSTLRDFQLESERMEPAIRNHIADAISNYGKEETPAERRAEEEEVEKLVTALEEQLAKPVGFFGRMGRFFKKLFSSPHR
jgi:hypothetical protein